MSRPQNRLTADLDFDAPGRRLGAIRLVHSDDRHAFAVIPVPVAVVVGPRPGPTVFLSAGTHGDEYEGQVVLHRLLHGLDPDRLTGRLIVMPALNTPAVLASTRCSPIDGANMNRVFPGDPRGGPSAALAAWIAQDVIPRTDFACDLHSGGSAARYIPCAYLHWGGDPAFRRRKLAAAARFGAPYTVIAAAAGDPGSMTAECDRQGVVMVATEFGGGGTVDPALAELARDCLMRLLAHAGVLQQAPAEAAPTRHIVLQQTARAPMARGPGIFEPLRRIGETVRAGELGGVIWPVDPAEAGPEEVRFATDGLIVAERHRPLVARGDLLFRLGEEADPEALLALA
ncbi:MAG TPA: succinylglutamate desuccinylase/aspartoacylase family protein [Falsiroseomonas sp.]|jgi:predicted deacylase|nr:succinylglutamate desuccinylase/aspartoacylase family protein [Falsiroseomonas sp.]